MAIVFDRLLQVLWALVGNEQDWHSGKDSHFGRKSFQLSFHNHSRVYVLLQPGLFSMHLACITRYDGSCEASILKEPALYKAECLQQRQALVHFVC